MMRTVDDSCSFGIQGDLLIRSVPGCRITHRLRTDARWRDIMLGALEFVYEDKSQSVRELGKRLNAHLDLEAPEISGLERRIIYTYAMGMNEC